MADAYAFSLFFFLLSSAASAAVITLPLSPFPSFNYPVFSDPLTTLNSLASDSLTRARLLRRPESNSNSSLTKTSIFARSFGGYSVSLSFGSPPQTMSFIFDTGSSLVWFPCTSRYLCSKCTFPNVDPTKIPAFVPKRSSSARIIGCQNPKCEWVLGSRVKNKCPKCDPKVEKCSQACPAYLISYGSGSTAGLLLSETMSLPGKKVPDFLVGCSFLSIHQPAGIAGFGRGIESIPSQLGLKKFSYCLLSRRFDDTPVSSNLILDSTPDPGDSKTRGLIYTPFEKNPLNTSVAYRNYYYVMLRKIVVGGKAVKIPYKFLKPGSDGNGGTIVDSGSTFTFMEEPVFQAVTGEIEKQMRNYTRATAAEDRTGLKPCYDFSHQKSVYFPTVVFQFKGGAKMALPLTNYIAVVSNSGVVCVTLVTETVIGSQTAGGPAIILGAFQQQNYYMEYDLENERLGFIPKTCSVG